MSRAPGADALSVKDSLVAIIEDTGFRAHGLHVRAGDGTAEHRWAPDVREDIQSVAKGVCVLAVLSPPTTARSRSTSPWRTSSPITSSGRASTG